MTHRSLFAIAATLGLSGAAWAQAPDNALRLPPQMPPAEAPTESPLEAPKLEAPRLPAHLAAPSPSAPEGVKSLAERLRREREAQANGQRASPLGALRAASEAGAAGLGLALSPLKYLSEPISFSAAREREAAQASSLPSILQISGEPEVGIREAAQAGTERRAQTWRMNLDVPVTHFWGRATLSAGFARSEPGTSAAAEEASTPLQQNATVSLRQDIKKGALTGSAQVAFTGAGSRQDGAAGASSAAERDRNAKTESSARLKLQVTPGIALTGSHQSQIERSAALRASEPGSDAASAPVAEAGSASLSERWSVAREAARRSQSELGLEWKWSKSLALSVGASAIRSGQQAPQDGGDAWSQRWLRDESRANIALKRRTGGGSWGLDWSRGWAQQDSAAETLMQRSEDGRSDALSLQAERRVFGWLSLRGSWKLAGETNYLASRLSEQATRAAEARISGGLGALALRFSDWGSQSTLAGSQSGASGRREYGVRYETGGGAGVGMALEYSVRDEKAAAATSNWKLGITYR